MTIPQQTDRELAAAGQMLLNEVNKIARELRNRGLQAKVQGYFRGLQAKVQGYFRGCNNDVEYDFEVKRVTVEQI